MSGSASEYCDLVMKGGITSGLVYPSAALSLAGKYRFKNIGGTSAGAIAAAACAAAALGERRRALRSASIADDGSSNSADKAGLAGLKNVADALTGNEFIYRLFQPSLGARAAYRLIVTLASKAGLTKKMVAILLAILATGSLEFLLSLAALAGLAYWLGGPGGVFAAALPAVLCALAISALFGAARVARVMRRNQMGICTGLAPKRRFGKARPALTDWLHQVIQDLSGQGDGEPLLFEHLWNAERYPGEPETARTISLQIITTSVSHREPRTLPLEKGGFWFRREEFDALFPKTVVDWMVEQDASPIQNDTGTYYALPSGGRMPVLVAARMSLSFPLLISAVPLHERDYGSERASVEDDSDPEIEDEIELQKGMLAAAEALATGGTRPKTASAPDAKPIFRVCWFSDGGISSNFPIHLFDSPLPRWPTFAINLIYPKSDDVQRADVFLPTRNDQGWQRCYESIASRTAAAEVTAFLFGIIATMQNWRDILQSRAPGHRDRIVHVKLAGDEGGMNLNMPEEVLRSISGKGGRAGQELLEKFDFNNHYWVRWRNVAAATEQFVIDFSTGATPPVNPACQNAYGTAASGDGDAPSYKFSGRATTAATFLFRTMTRFGAKWSKSNTLRSRSPRPHSHLRIIPTY